MYRNAESRFDDIPILEAPRSKFHMPKKHLTTFNTGDLIPFYSKLVYPGDTVSIKTNYVVRTTTPIKAPMDMSYLDTYYFFVPLRLLWEHFAEFMGENKLTAWEQPTEYTIPQITAPTEEWYQVVNSSEELTGVFYTKSGDTYTKVTLPEGYKEGTTYYVKKTGWKPKTLADHFGLRPGVGNYSVTALKFRAYALIYNEWFRNQNLQDGLMINTDDATVVGSNGSNYINDVQLGGKPMKVCKFHDYFTSCLPEPQKGPDVFIPLGSSAPIINNVDSVQNPLLLKKDGTIPAGGNVQVSGNYGIITDTAGNALTYNPLDTLVADLTNASPATVNQWRQACAIQHLFELDARGGTRLSEIIRNHFGVTSSDARLQRPEYIGGERKSMNVTQVVQTSETSMTSPQGNIAGYSLTIDSHDDVSFSSEEHGYIIGLTCVRTNHTYQQGIAREDSYKDRLEFYWPSLDNIGEQAVLNKEIFVTGTEQDEEVFGYQERYAEARSDFNTISGEFRDEYEQSLGVWHYGDKYDKCPALGPDWIQETEVNMDKTLQVTSEVADQIHADFYIDATYVRRMAMYAIPGLDRM